MVGDESNANGYWYYDWYGIQDFHNQGIDGSGVTIAVIDSQINLEVPTLQRADITVMDVPGCTNPATGAAYTPTSTDIEVSRHGTNVVSLIVGSGQGYPGQTGVKGIAPAAKILYFPVYGLAEDVVPDDCEPTESFVPPMGQFVMSAVDAGADIISVSATQSTGAEAILYALEHDVIIVAGLSNDTLNVTPDGEPGTLNGVVTVRATLPDGSVPLGSVTGEENLSEWVDVGAPGADIMWQGTPEGGWEAQDLAWGSSLATPIVAAEIALAMQMYPDATPNQILQSLIHNTGTESHDVEFETSGRYGYGIADPISLLAADPTQYEDVNPFIEEGPRVADEFGWGPTLEQLGGGQPTASPEPTETAEPNEEDNEPAPNEDTDSSLPAWLLPSLIGVGALILIGVIVAIIVTARSRKTP